MEDPWYVIERVKDLDTPSLIIYLERVKQNIQKAIEIIHDINRLRPHIKTNKSKEISAKAVNNYMQIPVFIDINVGMNRTGIITEKAKELFDYCAKLKGIQPIGLHAYDGHINMADFEERKSACMAAIKPVEKLREE